MGMMLRADLDVASLFGLEMDTGADASAGAGASSISGIVCGKCKGKGKFVSYTGRIVGNCFACDGSGIARSVAPVLSAPVDVSAIVTAFEAARGNGIKTPKLRLDGFVFSRAPDHGRNAGALYVKRKGGGDEGSYLGKIAGGAFFPSRDCDEATKARVIGVASAPHDAAKAYGLRTGECSCCGRELTNGISIDLGIGPICRSKFGW